MASETRKVLGQVNPAATTLTDAYTVPAGSSAVVSSIVVCNQAIVGTTFRLSVAVGGAADTAKQYLYYDVSLIADGSFTASIGMTLGPSDIVRVYAGNATTSFNMFGAEIA